MTIEMTMDDPIQEGSPLPMQRTPGTRGFVGLMMVPELPGARAIAGSGPDAISRLHAGLDLDPRLTGLGLRHLFGDRLFLLHRHDRFL